MKQLILCPLFSLVLLVGNTQTTKEDIGTYDAYMVSLKVDNEWVDYGFKAATHIVYQKQGKFHITGDIFTNEYTLLGCTDDDTQAECLATDIDNGRVIITAWRTQEGYKMLTIEYEDTIFSFGSSK